MVSRGPWGSGNRLVFPFDLLIWDSRLVESPGGPDSLIRGLRTPLVGVVDGHGSIQVCRSSRYK